MRWTSTYDPFGQTASTTGSAATTLGYQARYHDATSGLVDMAARAYQPTTGRFTSLDTIIGSPRTTTGLNRYLYGKADPINYFDPDGHLPNFIGAIQSLWDHATAAADSLQHDADQGRQNVQSWQSL